ncbi:MAG: protein-L-isoaspartate(D-aspartate) O-methyltransferase [Bacteroidales bacterium]|nr:protein-L-isoaspartate(D-aspartate) O-methyltransferase [Bacteroidales bacterium]MBK9358444.1 protein-L-isoaspartate(D-aspartate) O-methyltransferase [Bacteroidales bacterium]
MTDYKLADTFRHKGLRKKLVESIRSKGIKDENVLKAMEAVPRHLFFDSGFLEFAYEDKAFPIGAGQTISQPFTVAFQTELLRIRRGDKVLEVGTGSGYQASILYQMGAKVFSIERQRVLFTRAKEYLPKMGYSVKVFFGDGYKGLPAFAPFDKIIVTAGAPFIPDALADQLKPGGILVIPVDEGDSQLMTTLEKMPDGSLKTNHHGRFRFVPLLGDKAND